MPRQRDYKAEYQRRLARGLERNLPPSVARGKPKKGEKSLSQMRAETLSSKVPKDNPFEKAIKLLKKNMPLGKAAKESGVSQKKLKDYISSQAGLVAGKSSVIKSTAKGERRVPQYSIQQDNRPIEWHTYSGGKVIAVTLSDGAQKSLNGQYLNDVRKALNGDLTALRKWRGVSLVDSQGNKIPLETNIKALRTANKGPHPNPYRIAG